MPEPLRVPPLRSGGVMLGYQCNQSCRHCNYRSRPGAGEWIDESLLDKVLDALTRERRLIDVHFAGGEATLNRGLLLKAIETAVKKKIRLSYLETNGFYAETAEKAKAVLEPLKQAGLPAILLSVSPYHNEFIPLQNTLNCLEAGIEVFGEDGVFPWLGHFIPMIGKMDPSVPHSLEEFLAANSLAPGDPALLGLFPLTPGGRAPEDLAEFFPPRSADSFRGWHCLEILQDVSHFHIDPYGNLFTGHCPGIVAGRLPDLHEVKTTEKHPVYTALCLGGPHALMEHASRECGFEPDPRGYGSPCHLCLQVRKALTRHNPANWPELHPPVFYQG